MYLISINGPRLLIKRMKNSRRNPGEVGDLQHRREEGEESKQKQREVPVKKAADCISPRGDRA